MSREAILLQIRSALAAAGSTPGPIPRLYQTEARLQPEDRVNLFIERVQDYDARVFHSSPDRLAHDIAEILLAAGRTKIVIPHAIPAAWLDTRIEWVIEGNPSLSAQLPNAALESCAGVLTRASVGVAESGTLVLQHGELEGRRVLTLLPDYHLCVLEAAQVVETLPECFARLQGGGVARCITFVSGPSATADIEMTRIKGVHGPRFLDLVLLP